MMRGKFLPDGRHVWEPYVAAFAFVFGVVFSTLLAVVLLMYGCTTMGSNGFLPY
jgi:hypothetical protein